MKNFNFSYRRRKEEELADKLNAHLNGQLNPEMSDEEKFSFADFNAEDAERGGYSDYSYWRSTLRAFFQDKMAVFFLLIMLIWTALSHALDLAFRLPGLNFLNRTAGLLLGFARGVLLAYGLCWLLKDNYLPQAVIDNGLLLPWFCGSNPLLNISILNS